MKTVKPLCRVPRLSTHSTEKLSKIPWALCLTLLLHAGVLFSLTLEPGRLNSAVLPGSFVPQPRIVQVQFGSNKPSFSPAIQTSRAAPELGRFEQMARLERRHLAHRYRAINVMQPTTPIYFHVSELTQRPLVKEDIPANLRLHISDVVNNRLIVRLFINQQGTIDKVAIEKSEPQSDEESALPFFVERIVLNTFSQIKFYPAQIDGQPVNSQLKIEVKLEAE